MTVIPVGRQILIEAIKNAGGVPILVGGAVRDFIIAGESFPSATFGDWDIEVYRLEWDALKKLLTREGYHYDEVGELFRVLKVQVSGIDLPVDLSMPRSEKATGDGHRDFEVIGYPFMTFEEASSRRDFTMNALGFNLIDGTLLDPYGGVKDIQDKVIRHVSDAFSEDPLRPLRAARFAARFGFSLTEETFGMCEEMRPLADSLPSERIWGEIEKAVHESLYLGAFFRWLGYMEWIDLFPEINALGSVRQDKEWHPEGDVFQHTCYALDYWSQNLRTGNKSDDLITAIAILCHDFGKVTTTEWNEEKQHITAYGHEEAGAEPTRTFLHRLRQYWLSEQVIPLVENHLAPVYNYPISAKAVRRLSTKVKRLDLLANVSRADQAGRPPRSPYEGFDKINQFTAMVNALDVPRGGPKPLVGGDYLISLGLTPGPVFKELLDWAYELQLEGWVTDEDEARLRVSQQVKLMSHQFDTEEGRRNLVKGLSIVETLGEML